MHHILSAGVVGVHHVLSAGVAGVHHVLSAGIAGVHHQVSLYGVGTQTWGFVCVLASCLLTEIPGQCSWPTDAWLQAASSLSGEWRCSAFYRPTRTKF